MAKGSGSAVAVHGGGKGAVGLIRMASEPALVGAAGDDTRARIFAEILTAGPFSRTEVAKRLSLSQSTVTKAVNPLIEMGYLLEVGERSSGNGRPQRMLKVAEDRYVVVGVKLAPAHVTVVLTDLSASVLARHRQFMEAGYSPQAGVEAAVRGIEEVLDTEPDARERVLGVGVGLGGHVDADLGRCVHSGVLGWDDVDVAGLFSAALDLPVVVNNDVNALVVAERWFGAGRDSASFAVVTVGAGVGCGLMLGGDLYTGVSGLAGEFGHMPLESDGLLCSCGNRGCLETVASDLAILRDISQHAGVPCTSMEEAVRLARSGDDIALNAFAAMGRSLGRGLATLCNLLNLDKIILTGESIGSYDLFGEACQDSLRDHGFSSAADDCVVVVHDADHSLWARGAACLVIRESVYAAM
ncbi:ROK family protein [Nonomuraea sp. NPDC050783]|uniref:ROK family transcriptional regulator n=1 Tax=Nonomuraea sp. NPDC050783 TaxID=3154634 RepID=UPI00346745F5